MACQVVTSFSPEGARQYGARAVKAFRRFSRLPLTVYVDVPTAGVGVETRLTTDIDDWPETKARLPMRNPAGSRPERYTWHARRFGVKPFVWWDAAVRLQAGLLLWLDGDVVAYAPVPDSLPVDLLGDADVAFLGRGGMHPENGFVGFRVPEALPLLEWLRDAYRTGAFAAWTDGWTDCHALRHGLRETGVKARDLTSERYVGKSHIWPVSPLAPYFRHYKGKLKLELARC